MGYIDETAHFLAEFLQEKQYDFITGNFFFVNKEALEAVIKEYLDNRRNNTV